MSYLVAAGSRIAHKSVIAAGCFYWMRRKPETDYRTTERKPRGCSVCDECQRLEKLARVEVKKAVAHHSVERIMMLLEAFIEEKMRGG